MTRSKGPSRRDVVVGTLAAGAMAALGDGHAAAADGKGAKRPNILFIMADDLGFADLSCYGRNFSTPHIDRLATEGARFTQAYANSAVCSPTRTALITGRYQYRLPVGLDEPLTGVKDDLGLDPKHPTLPSLLRKRGYRTSLVGKWHLGYPPRFGPLQSGYDRFFGIHHGFEWYFDHQPASPAGLHEGEKRVPQIGYMTDLLGDRAEQEIKAAAAESKPLFLSLHFTAPHWPWETPEDAALSKSIKNPHHYDGGSLEIYRQMLASLDRNVGKVLKSLDEAGIADNTIVVFTSDNGGERFSDNWPLSGMKGELLEGGIRVPTLVRWPGRIAPGSIVEQTAMSMDWLPTLLEAAGGAPDPAHPSDGISLLPVLRGAAQPQPRQLFWRFKANEQAAFRDGDWKYLKLGGREWLFNLAEDPRERANRREHEPARFERMKAEHARWSATMLPYDDKVMSHNIKGLTADRY